MPQIAAANKAAGIKIAAALFISTAYYFTLMNGTV
jgi:hypothetical protein